MWYFHVVGGVERTSGRHSDRIARSIPDRPLAHLPSPFVLAAGHPAVVAGVLRHAEDLWPQTGFDRRRMAVWTGLAGGAVLDGLDPVEGARNRAGLSRHGRLSER